MSNGGLSYGGHGAFRLGLVRFGWIRSGKAVEARIDLFWSGALRFGKAV